MRRGRTSSLLVAGSLIGLALAPPTAQAAVSSGLFQPHVTQALPASVRGVAFGDVTGDGRADVVATTDTSLVVMAQSADGSLAAPVSYAHAAAATSANELAIGISDLDGDGDNDVVLTSKAGVQLWDQVAGGTLRYDWSFLPPGARDLEVVDVSGDGQADLVVNTGAGIRVYWQIFGDLMSARPTAEVSTGNATEVEVGDVTGDGLPDIVSALGRTVEVRAQQPDLSFAAPVTYLSGGVSGWETVNGLALGDTNGDGRLDVHVTTGGNSPTARVVTREQTPNGVLGAPQALTSYDIPETIEAADVTGDGRDDLLVLHGGWNRLGVYDLTPGTNPAETLFAIPYASHYPVDGLAVGDVSGDGQADVGIADYNQGVVLLRHSPAGTDATPPQTTITSGPSGGTPDPTATFTFTSSEAGSYECQFDQEPRFTTCTSPKTYSGLTAGAHSFQVRAVDLVGNVDPTPEYQGFQVSAPDTVITGGPTGTVRSDTASFAFDSGTTSAAGFQCQWDGGLWTACTSPATKYGLAAGPHTFGVRAVSTYGVADPFPATRSWTVETPADVAVSTTGPASVRKNGTITWTTVVSNPGPAGATGVVLAQTVPSGVTSAKATGCTGSTTLTCPVGTLAAGTSRTFTITGKVTATKGTLTSTATVTSTSWDRNTANDRATATSTVGR
ncbi:FG-GAP-like repeat-containing protein [Nocardioides iriomotensis]|uniref:DUF11 domain-containing protein n=1 Tax=Nocardioides iriomotensis TaxID=715784 RepID=A0A4Q5JB40_9ACTN|nr:FG-GAP-like repeat-containing protein [Nocardioides iriomotensis]RYU15268.1 DUF11 domain-containing protein [Nocardioides iriomotensis]